MVQRTNIFLRILSRHHDIIFSVKQNNLIERILLREIRKDEKYICSRDYPGFSRVEKACVHYLFRGP